VHSDTCVASERSIRPAGHITGTACRPSNSVGISGLSTANAASPRLPPAARRPWPRRGLRAAPPDTPSRRDHNQCCGPRPTLEARCTRHQQPNGMPLLTATQFAHDGVSEHADVRSMSCAFWRPDPRHGAEPREPSYADWRSPAETGCRAASAPRRFAPAVRVGLPTNRSLSEDFNGLGRTPERVHADVVAAPEVIHSSAART
jgi:hypothetical protein